MTTVTGEITGYLELLGAAKDDERVLRLVQSSSDFREADPFTEPGTDETWMDITSVREGISLHFLNGVLDRVVIVAQHEFRSDAYRRPTELIVGLDISTATREDVVAALGEPWKSAKKFVKHKVGKRYLHTSFLNGKIDSIVVMSRPL